MSSTLTLTPCDSHTCLGEWPKYRSCSMDTFGDDNGPYLTSPQYKEPPSSPLPCNSVKLDDGPTIRRRRPSHLREADGPARRKARSKILRDIRSLQVCYEDIPPPPLPSLFRRFIDTFIRLPPQIPIFGGSTLSLPGGVVGGQDQVTLSRREQHEMPYLWE